MDDLNILVEKAELFATDIIAKFSDKIIFHDLKYAHRYIKNVKIIAGEEKLSEKETCLAVIAAWFHASSFGAISYKVDKETNEIKSDFDQKVSAYVNQFFDQHAGFEECRGFILTTLKHLGFPHEITNKVEGVLQDAYSKEFVGKKAQKNVKRFYEEALIHNLDIGRKSFYDVGVAQVEQMQFYTTYGKRELEPKLLALIDTFKKDQKELAKQEDIALKRELNINAEELKQLKKNLKSSKGRDDRGIQTLFRTTSKNHYVLNQMIDRKANIMITVNSIILSLVIGGVLGDQIREQGSLEFISIIILAVTNLLSIFFAILSIRPEDTHGKFTEDQIRNKQGNLLFYGNFHQMHPDDFEWGMLQLINDGKYLYTSMIKDIYYLGKTLNRKNKLIRWSLNIFIIGLGLSLIFNLLCRCFFGL